MINASDSDTRMLVDLIKEEPEVLDVFRTDELGQRQIHELNRVTSDLLFRIRLVEPFHGAGYKPRHRLQRERAGILICRDYSRRVNDTTERSNNPEDRIFPWCDEADQIFDYVVDKYRNRNKPERILNMCCGSGSIALSLARHWTDHVAIIDGIDINPKAIEMSRFNHKMNDYELLFGTRHIRFDVGDLFQKLNKNEKYDLLVVNPPHALTPPQYTAAGYHSGGQRGTAVVEEMLYQCRDYLQPGGRIISSCYSLGDENSPTHIEEILSSTLNISLKKAKESVIVLRDCRVWRFLDIRCMPNPMPLEYMVVRCADPTYKWYEAINRDSEKVMHDYVDNWIEKLKLDKSSHGGRYSRLYYVMIDYQLPATQLRRSRI